MTVQIRKYNPVTDYTKLMKVITSEGEEWKDYLQPSYQRALEKSTTYIAQIDDEVIGYSRSLNDFDQFVWVIDLLVHKEFRGHSTGRKLMECLALEFPGLDIYVMSDVDDYYRKLGYKQEGSIFKVQ